MPSEGDGLTARASEAQMDLGGFRLKVTNPELWEVSFKRRSDASQEDSTGEEFKLSLRVQRPRQDAVVVELVAEANDDSSVEFRVGYRVGILVEPTSDIADLGFDQILRGVAAQIGPVVVYPYLRELLSTLSGRAGIAPVVLPVMNVGAMFDPEAVALPEAPDDESDLEDEAWDHASEDAD